MEKKLMKVTKLQWNNVYKNLGDSKKVFNFLNFKFNDKEFSLYFRKRDSLIVIDPHPNSFSRDEMEDLIKKYREMLKPFLSVPIEDINKEMLKIQKPYKKLVWKIKERKKPVRVDKRTRDKINKIHSLWGDIKCRYKGYKFDDPKAIKELPFLIEEVERLLFQVRNV